jgi:pentose-5-phosphate-3-epimerase
VPTADPISLIKTIHEHNMKAGVAISPDTPSTVITDEVGAAADMLLVMTVYPGAGCFFLFSKRVWVTNMIRTQAKAARNS